MDWGLGPQCFVPAVQNIFMRSNSILHPGRNVLGSLIGCCKLCKPHQGYVGANLIGIKFDVWCSANSNLQYVYLTLQR